jgi:hypothetical protein
MLLESTFSNHFLAANMRPSNRNDFCYHFILFICFAKTSTIKVIIQSEVFILFLWLVLIISLSLLLVTGRYVTEVTLHPLIN